MRTLLKIVSVVMAASCSFGAHAGTQTGTVTNVNVRASDGLIVVYLGGTASGRAACAASQPYWIIKSETSTAGKQQLAQLMIAQATGKSITIVGMGTCTRWSDGEDIDTIVL
jgi:hypothetical protein